ncbi:MAG TPA: hypothetical protein EYP98_06945, partial [Planctomycetes bacterium]|nr:hypothetical protein [Planctomycetota bacterium]
RTTEGGLKTRRFDDVQGELKTAFEVHDAAGSVLGGVHFEMTGEDVTECTGGPQELSEADLSRSYHTYCDPRLNYAQSLEMAFLLARQLQQRRRCESDPGQDKERPAPMRFIFRKLLRVFIYMAVLLLLAWGAVVLFSPTRTDYRQGQQNRDQPGNATNRARAIPGTGFQPRSFIAGERAEYTLRFAKAPIGTGVFKVAPRASLPDAPWRFSLRLTALGAVTEATYDRATSDHSAFRGNGTWHVFVARTSYRHTTSHTCGSWLQPPNSRA